MTEAKRQLEYNPAITKPFDFAVDQLTHLGEYKSVSSATGGNNAVYGGVGSRLSSYFEYPCHVHMSDVNKDAEVVWSKFCIPDGRLKNFTKISRDYFDWITSDESPWKPAFDMGMSFSDKKTFSRTFWFEKGFIFDKLDVIPSNVLHNFLIASRILREWPYKVKIWHEVWKSGVSPEMALIVATCWNGKDENDIKEWYSLYNGDFYDWPLDCICGGEEYVKNFLNKKMDKTVFNKSYAESHNYKPVNKIWGSQARGTKIDPYYGMKTETGYFKDNFVLAKYAEQLGRKQNIMGGFGSSSNYINWECKIEDIITIAKEEQRRLTA